jgi:hypothetical protein
MKTAMKALQQVKMFVGSTPIIQKYIDKISANSYGESVATQKAVSRIFAPAVS